MQDNMSLNYSTTSLQQPPSGRHKIGCCMESVVNKSKMLLFSKDPKEIAKIANILQDCGCCARCVLRYVGLKDMNTYRRSLQELKDEVNKLIHTDAQDPEGQEIKTDTHDLIETNSNSTKCDKTGDSNDDANHKTGNSDDCNENLGDVKEHDVLSAQPTTGEINDKIPVNNEDFLESAIGTGNPSKRRKLSGEIVNSQAVEISTEKDTNMSDSNDRSDMTNICYKITNDADNTGMAETLLTKTEIEKPSCVAMDTSEPLRNGSGPVLETHNSREKETRSANKTGQKRSCIVCLGILEEFTSDEFLQKIKVASVDDGYEFTNYICSLLIPVSIILREHALMLYLKDTFGSVYDSVKLLDIPTIKDVWKWRNGPILRDILGVPFDQKSTFDIILNFIYPDSDRECSFLLDLMSDTFRKRKQDRRNNKKKGAFQVYNRANVSKAVQDMSTQEFKSHFRCPPRVPTKSCTCDIKCQNEAIFIAGRYNKYSRTLSQTPWIIEGQRKSETSVEELICTEIDKAFRPTEHKFSSAGREDVDVLMLGDGRPFIVELTNPHRVSFTQEEITHIQTVANSATKDIRIRDLQIVSREETEKLKEGEIDKIKNYLATCWSKTPLSAEQLNKLTEIKDLKLLQKTPIRVLHRRPLSTREKCIHSMTVEKVDDYHFKLGLKTQAGTYIKEFVHGDFGRTKPNLTALLGEDCDILELDVQSVELDWPKKIQEPEET